MTLAADWGAPPNITAFITLRTGGVSVSGCESFNLATHVGDDPDAVRANRRVLTETNGWAGEPVWLEQVHGADIITVTSERPETPRADGAVTSLPGTTLAVLTADCLPVLACDRQGTVVGAFHAGWRGLLAGVLENGLAAMGSDLDLLVWIGPAIGAENYQVGAEVREAFLGSDPEHEADFAADGTGHWRFNLAGAARRRLAKVGVKNISGGHWDTYRNSDLFFSHRRQAPCGRMAAIIRIEGKL